MRNMQEFRNRRRRRDRPLVDGQTAAEGEALLGVDDGVEYDDDGNEKEKWIPSLKGGISDARVLDDAEIDQMVASREGQ